MYPARRNNLHMKVSVQTGMDPVCPTGTAPIDLLPLSAMPLFTWTLATSNYKNSIFLPSCWNIWVNRALILK